jgi:hypothetical protein
MKRGSDNFPTSPVSEWRYDFSVDIAKAVRGAMPASTPPATFKEQLARANQDASAALALPETRAAIAAIVKEAFESAPECDVATSHANAQELAYSTAILLMAFDEQIPDALEGIIDPVRQEVAKERRRVRNREAMRKVRTPK